jgi:hypothetical protein
MRIHDGADVGQDGHVVIADPYGRHLVLHATTFKGQHKDRAFTIKELA